ARYQDGQPFARLVIVPDLVQGPDVVRAVPNGKHRFTFTETVDLRLDRALSIGRARARVSLDVFNLLDSRLELSEDVVWGTAFRTPQTLQPPRSARVGLRIFF